MQVESADAVLVVAAVLVVVDALGIHHVVAAPGADRAHQAPLRVERIDDERALPRPDVLPHLAHVPIAVEVLTGILVEQAVAIVVLRTHRRAVRLRGELVHVRAVGIVVGAQVDGLLVEQLGDVGVLAVVLDEMPREPEDALARRDLAGMAPALEEGRRFVGVLARLLVGERELPDGLAAERRPDLIQVDDVRALLRPSLHPVVELRRGVVVLEVHHAPLLGLHLLVVREREHRVPVTRTGDGQHAAHGIARRLRSTETLGRDRIDGKRTHGQRERQREQMRGQRHVAHAITHLEGVLGARRAASQPIIGIPNTAAPIIHVGCWMRTTLVIVAAKKMPATIHA